MDAQKYVDEEEDLDDGAADSRSADHSGSHVNWLQRRRNTAVVPESKSTLTGKTTGKATG